MKILLLAGTGEARSLVAGLQAQGHHVTASLAGATRSPRDLGCETRVGGFGGAPGFVAWLDAHQPDLVLDATHPFAERITQRTALICAKRGLAYLLFLRPPWTVDPSAGQIIIKTAADARDHIASGATVFLATGRQTLEQFAGLSDCRLLCRQIDPPDGPFPFPNGAYVIGRPPFSMADEVALFERLGVDVLVVKNSGGAASASKLEAARELGLTTLMLARPTPPVAPQVSTVDEALDWVRSYADH